MHSTTGRFAITNCERILLLLSEFRRYENEYRLPEKLSQDGIARIVGMRRGNVAKELIKLRKRGFVTERLVHFEGSRRRRKGYFLTDAGLNLSDEIRDHVKNSTVIFKDHEGLESETKVDDIRQILGKDMLLAEVVSNIAGDGVFNAGDVDKEKMGGFVAEHVPTTKFVGREEEIAKVQEISKRALEGKGTLLLISGEAGVGKTRLVSELKKRVDPKRTYFLQGNCLYQTAIDPYIPFVEVLKDYLGKVEKSRADLAISKITATAPEFLGLLPVVLHSRGADVSSPERDIKLTNERVRIFETINELLSDITRERGVVIFIDDLHWADSGSLRLVHYLARNVGDRPVLLIGAYRPEELLDAHGKSHPLKDTLSKLKKGHIVEEIALDRLDLDETMDIVKERLDKKVAVTDEFAALVHEGTEGNPFFIEEILNILEDSEIEMHPEKIAIPRSINDTIMRRIDRLDDPEKAVLENCAVIGTKFDVELLAMTMERDDEEILDSLESLCDFKLIEEDAVRGAEGYRFNHSMIKEVLYCNLNLRKRRLLHEKTGMALEELFKDNPADGASELAYHFSNTKEFDKAYRYSWMAGERASRIYSFEEAADNCEIALRALRRMTEGYPEAAKSGDSPDGKNPEDVSERGRLSLPKDDGSEISRRLVEVHERLGYVWDVLGKWDKSIESYDMAFDLAPDEKKRAVMLARKADVQRKKGQFDEAERTIRHALASIGEDCKEKCLLNHCNANISFSRGDFKRALESYRESLRIAENIDDLEMVGKINHNMGMIYYLCDDERALECLDRSVAIFMEQGNQMILASAYDGFGLFHKSRGDYAKALSFFEKSLEIRKNIGDKVSVARNYYNIGVVHFNLEDFDRTQEYFEKSLRIIQRIDDLVTATIMWQGLGLVHFHKGEYDKSADYLNKSLEYCTKTGDKVSMSYTLVGLARFSVARNNDPEESLELCNKALSLSKEVGIRVLIGESHQLLGQIYRRMGKWQDSTFNFEESQRIFSENKRPVELAETRVEFALMWKLKGDLDKARENLLLALKLFSEKGIERKAEKARKELAELGK